jgi:hypothetical protein
MLASLAKAGINPAERPTILTTWVLDRESFPRDLDAWVLLAMCWLGQQKAFASGAVA